MNDEIYQDRILDHAECSQHRGTFDNPTATCSDKNPLCGDEIQLYILVENNIIQKVSFEGKGCIISQAAVSMLCEAIEGKSLEEIQQMQANDMLDLLGVKLSVVRQKCGLLGFKVLKTIVYTIM